MAKGTYTWDQLLEMGVDPRTLREAGMSGGVRVRVSEGKFTKINEARKRAKARGTQGTAADAMTKAERVRGELLATRYRAGEILPPGPRFEGVRLQLAKGSSYTPDYAYAERESGLVILEEVKGSRGWKLDDEGRTKWKIAGELWPLFVFRGVVLIKGVWTTEEYRPRGPWL